MLNQQPYANQQIVWAKVQPYPWWPAKIVKTLQQTNQTLYKILFFADKTYSYLHSTHLEHFDTFKPPANQSPITPETEQSLQKAIKLVHEYRSKSLRLKKLRESQQTNGISVEAEFQSEKKCDELIEEKSQSVGGGVGSQMAGGAWGQRGTMTDSISIKNVIEMIEATRRSQKKLDYCYEKRKQQISVLKQLKQKLLLKYNLLQINKKQSSKHKPASQSKPHKAFNPKPIYKKYIKSKYRVSKRAHHDIQSLKQKCAVKVKRMLLSQQDDSQLVRRQSKDVIRRIVFLADNSDIKLNSLMVTLMKSIARCGVEARCEQKLTDFKHYLERLQHQKQWDEEGSKLTMINSIS